ncbi:hypothetical protein AXW84_22360 [Hymenobacter sp. PAMC 26628]|nr:hypothetical protein AXW84_22360 [Hymenobacter sp. PAMC 26628]
MTIIANDYWTNNDGVGTHDNVIANQRLFQQAMTMLTGFTRITANSYSLIDRKIFTDNGMTSDNKPQTVLYHKSVAYLCLWVYINTEHQTIYYPQYLCYWK